MSFLNRVHSISDFPKNTRAEIRGAIARGKLTDVEKEYLVKFNVYDDIFSLVGKNTIERRGLLNLVKLDEIESRIVNEGKIKSHERKLLLNSSRKNILFEYSSKYVIT